METLKVLLIANRGEIAVRIAKTAKRLGICTIAIYTVADATSQHVLAADIAALLPGDDSTAYADGDAIIEIAQANNVDAIIPGYGFLSENVEFAQKVLNRGMMFVGPSPDVIEGFGLKHCAREMAIRAKVPTVPGSEELLTSEEEVAVVAGALGYPVKSRGDILFKNSGVFLERYYPVSHHVEVQIFGNSEGEAIHVGERECSIQRRH
ncbi:putative urea carboxylase [Aspergillus tubingensis]|uniref:putative urea carboxylase n=1 Tax=Aspergillus tubingensis TaxID=5068 RepID=UPI00157808F6|nr:putative urea carboxylase [Aspergillus tubingensis]GFN10745.1 putative urea carboxylase [Aspergillus tubingensis]